MQENISIILIDEKQKSHRITHLLRTMKEKEANKNDNETNLLPPRLDDFAILRTD